MEYQIVILIQLKQYYLKISDMKYIKLALLFSLVFNVSCKQSPKSKVDYYPGGEIRSISFFNRNILSKKLFLNENGDTTKINFYDSSGSLNRLYFFNYETGNNYYFEIKNDIPDGTAIEITKDGYKIIRHYKEDTIHGKELILTPEMDTSRINWYIDGSLVLGVLHNCLNIGDTARELRYVNGRLVVDSLIIIKSENEARISKEYYPYGDLSRVLGALNYDLNWNVLPEFSDYYTVNIPDTIVYGDELPIKISSYFNHLINDVKQIQLQIGDLGNNLEFKGETINIIGEPNESFLKFKIQNYKVNYNFVTGILILTTINGKEIYPFFTDFYVKGLND